VMWEDLAEVRTLAVDKTRHGAGHRQPDPRACCSSRPAARRHARCSA
jgi:hypothetical protein